MKKVIASMVCGMLIFQSVAFGDSSPSIKVAVDGKVISTDVSPKMEDGRVLVPIRTLASLGVKFKWDSKTQTALVTKGSDEVKLTVNKKEALKNNKTVLLDVPVKMIQGRVLVPIRFLSESFGYNVNYTKSVVNINEAKLDLSKYYSSDRGAIKKVTSNSIEWKENGVTFTAMKNPEAHTIDTMSVITNDKNIDIKVQRKPDHINSISLSSTNNYVSISLGYDNGEMLVLIDLLNGKYEILNDLIMSQDKGSIETVESNNWSPDGTKIAFSYGLISETKLGIYDVKSKKFTFPKLEKTYLGVNRIMWLKSGNGFDYIADYSDDLQLKLYNYDLHNNSVKTIRNVSKDEMLKIDIGPTNLLDN